MIPKAKSNDFVGRFREIVSDPLNMLISRHEKAGLVEDDLVYLHNGHQVPLRGAGAYYEEFSDILVINRGVHEPLEEYAFQQMLDHTRLTPVMLELGAYWGHYSMWLKLKRPKANVFLVEPESKNIEAGRANFERHGYNGTFINELVGNGGFGVDHFLNKEQITSLDILHCDIQGYEVQMMQGAKKSFAEKRINYAFISTHSEAIHQTIRNLLLESGYRIEAESAFENHTTSFDGFVLAVSPEVPRVFEKCEFMGRQEITAASAGERLKYLTSLIK